MPKRPSSEITPKATLTKVNIQVSDQPELQRLITELAAGNDVYDEGVFLVKLWDLKIQLMQVMDPDNVPAFLANASIDVEQILLLRLKIKLAGISETILKLASAEQRVQYREASQRQIAEPDLVSKIQRSPFLDFVKELRSLPGCWRGLREDLENVNEVVQAYKDNLNQLVMVCEGIYAGLNESFKRAINLLHKMDCLENEATRNYDQLGEIGQYRVRKFKRDMKQLRSCLQGGLAINIDNYLSMSNKAYVFMRVDKCVEEYRLQLNHMVQELIRFNIVPVADRQLLECHEQRTVQQQEVVDAMQAAENLISAERVNEKIDQLQISCLRQWKSEFNGKLTEDAVIIFEFVFTSVRASVSPFRRPDEETRVALRSLARILPLSKKYEDLLSLVGRRLRELAPYAELHEPCIEEFRALIQTKNQNICEIAQARRVDTANAAHVSQLGFFASEQVNYQCEIVYLGLMDNYIKRFADCYQSNLETLRGFFIKVDDLVKQISTPTNAVLPPQHRA